MDKENFKNLPIQFETKVLTEGAWPVTKDEQAPRGLPQEVQSCMDTFM
jgi:hypothetical protein